MGYKHPSVKTCWIEIWWRNEKDKRMFYTSWYCDTTLVFFIFSLVYCEAFSIRISCHVIPFRNCLKRKQKVLSTLLKPLRLWAMHIWMKFSSVLWLLNFFLTYLKEKIDYCIERNLNYFFWPKWIFHLVWTIFGFNSFSLILLNIWKGILMWSIIE